MSNAIYSESLDNYIANHQSIKRIASSSANGLGDGIWLIYALDEMAEAAEAEVGRKVDIWDSIFSELIR
jgi:hypothetical protein